ncbi:hypothetical protein E2P81_ATG05914 [Venturia nashicola]|uniref:Uncharacterized protein n=1 Tax=Venturia nashicola TaxID=86259 RepID=A0A4Z1P4D6_9PEZI|nr:hypothetical protein E6O75_ATG06061 [Venturia nashicola]TLD29620.1 hypothetical protein E2P81_ATG05914 [Venturia nashicola]
MAPQFVVIAQADIATFHNSGSNTLPAVIQIPVRRDLSCQSVDGSTRKAEMLGECLPYDQTKLLKSMGRFQIVKFWGTSTPNRVCLGCDARLVLCAAAN